MKNNQNQYSYFSSQINELRDNAVEASVSILGFKEPVIRQHIINELSQDPTHESSEGIMGNPVFEVLFPWQSQENSIQDFSSLHPQTIDAVKNDIPVPYKHQAESWALLNDTSKTNSLVVTSGTGSGKTECFMVPILDDLVRTQQIEGGALTGVRALFLYPLNALINSQRDRLNKWTKPFGKNISFCLYNGNTKENVRQKDPNEIISRDMLRETPPPILVTNATMLEYMLVRQKDKKIIDKSQGKLRWIVLDEAHSYVGSTAAELSLLLRRVMLAFDVKAKDVHFIATSATIGDDETAKTKLTNYLASLAGVSADQIHVVDAQRNVPTLNQIEVSEQAISLQQIEETDASTDVSSERYRLLENHPFARRLRARFVKTDNQGKTFCPPQDLGSLRQSLDDAFESKDVQDIDQHLLRWLDICSFTKAEEGRVAFLPLRGHLFQRTLSGLYACVNPNCSGKHNHPLSKTDHKGRPTWEFGYLYTQKRQHCKFCTYPVYEVAFCDECQTPHLLTKKQKVESAGHALIQFKNEKKDDFSLDKNEEELELDAEGLENQNSQEQYVPTVVMPEWSSMNRLIKPSNKDHYLIEEALLTNEAILNIDSKEDESIIKVFLKETNDNASKALQHCYFCDTESKYRKVIRGVYLGAPFYMSAAAPILLNYCPKDEKHSDSLPYQGRQMITFSDSRQGTAKITMKIRQDSERRSLRHVIYSILTSDYIEQDIDTEVIEQEISDLTDEIEEARAKLEQGIDKEKNERKISRNGKLILEEKEKLAGTDQRPIISWDEMAKRVSKEEEFKYLKRSIGKVASVNNITSDKEIAELLLLNEFAKRPKNANTLETLGLVSVVYEQLQHIKAPGVWIKELGLSERDWHAFLKLTLDFYVREQSFVNLSFPQLNSISIRFIGSKKLLAPNSNPKLDENDIKYIKNWTQINERDPNHSSRMIRMLCLAANLDLSKAKDKDIANEVMTMAWKALTDNNILKRATSDRPFIEYHLNYEDVSFTLPSEVWVCPVSHRFLDTTFRQLTPYLPPFEKLSSLQNNIEQYICSKVSIPVFKPEATDIPLQQQADDWIEGSSVIKELREQSLWTDISSSVIRGMNSIVTEEHSAQLDQKALQKYEKRFKEDKDINILNCSTTMEMGVDIGGITSVAMNNVPPHPANYLQRTGRAGRRGETRATAYTLCKNNPHEQMVFLNSSWAFTTNINPPYITLNSEQIVQRHINAYLLSLFLNKGSMDESAVTLKSGWFFFGWSNLKEKDTVKDNVEQRIKQPGDSSEWFKTDTPFRKIQEWLLSLRLQNQSSNKRELATNIESITRDSNLYYSSIDAILGHCLQALQGLEKYFIDRAIARIEEYQSVKADKKGDSKPYLTKLIMDLKGIANGYLLSDLARYGFLPRYGFPSGIVEFDPYHSASFKKNKKDKANSKTENNQEREDNQSLRNGKPMRDIAIAIREYAPGNEVAVDGLVYKSAGIELSRYLTPASNEAQIIRNFWHCTNCGNMNDTFDTNEVTCQGCGYTIDKENKIRFVEPMGFRVDYVTRPHSKIDGQTFVPIEQPKIQANGDRKKLFSPALGDYKVDDEGVIFYQSGGVNGHGYFICLHCGRAESVKYNQNSPGFKSQKYSFEEKHIPLKPVAEWDFTETEKLEKAKGVCSRNGYQTQYLHIGAIDKTNVFELYLKDPENQDFYSDEGAEILLSTLAVALRDALASCHGISPDELGVGTKPVRLKDQKVTAIYIYDKASGGAGFASAGPQFVHEMFKKARDILACPASCDSACHSCLLTYDTRFIVDSLDRHVAIKYLGQIQNYLELSEGQKLFQGAHFCNLEIEQRVTDCLSGAYSNIYLYLQGQPSEWQLSSALNNRIAAWTREGIKVNIVLLKSSIDSLDVGSKKFLYYLNEFNSNISIYTIEESDETYLKSNYLLQMSSDSLNSVVTLGTTDKEAYIPNDEYWSVSGKNIIVESESLKVPVDQLEKLKGSVLKEFGSNNARLFVIDSELDGSILDFGKKFWEKLREVPDVDMKLNNKTAISKITYHDKYLCSPLSTILLGQLLNQIKDLYEIEDKDGFPVTDIYTLLSEISKRKNKANILDKWKNSELQKTVQSLFFEKLNLNVECFLKKPNELDHHRYLLIEWVDNSKTKILLDHGFGFMYFDDFFKPKNVRDKASLYEFDINDDKAANQVNIMFNNSNKGDFIVKSKPHKTTIFTVFNPE